MSMHLISRGVGPVHERMSVGLTRCGKSLGRYLDSREHEGEHEDVTCKRCKSLHVKGERQSWRSSR